MRLTRPAAAGAVLGLGLVVTVPASDVDAVQAALEASGERVQRRRQHQTGGSAGEP